MDGFGIEFAGGSPFTVADLANTPHDGRHYELIDGTLVVSPVPGVVHQRMVYSLAVALDAACPPGLDVLPGPYAVRLSDITELLPDVVVAQDEDFTEECLPVAPLLVVEVFMPSTRLTDLNNKRAIYQRFGVPSYWVIDPEDPALTVFELDAAGVYEQVAEVKGADAFEARRPFPVRVVPLELLGKLARK
jgi:Uma2 family endonuclease